MLTAMTTGNVASPLFAHPGDKLSRRSCFKMKSNFIEDPDDRGTMDVTDLLERMGLTEMTHENQVDEHEEPRPRGREGKSRPGIHLSGGGLVPETCMGPNSLSGVVRLEPNCCSQVTPPCTNPFKNHMRLALANDEDTVNTSWVVCATNPFSESSLNVGLGECGQSQSCVNPFFSAASTVSQATQTSHQSMWDIECQSMKALHMSGWYYGNASWQDSILLLQDTRPGTFLVRDSGDPDFLFSLSLQTVRGPTSVRLHYINSRFRLDAETQLIPSMPFFESVNHLVDYYIAKTDMRRKKSVTNPIPEQVWVDSVGQVYSNILISKPLLKQIPKLKHLCRLHVNRLVRYRSRHSVLKCKRNLAFETIPMIYLIGSLNLPQALIDYLREYPFSN